MSKLYRVVYFDGEYCDVELEQNEADQYYTNEEVKIITPLFNQELLAFHSSSH